MTINIGPLQDDISHFSGQELLAHATTLLPMMPSAIRYDDDYAGIRRTVRDPANNPVWEIKTDGCNERVDWGKIPEELVDISRHWLSWALQTYDATTASNLARLFKRHSIDFTKILSGLLQDPQRSKNFWNKYVVDWAQDRFSLYLCKSFLVFMCDHCLGPWTPDHVQYLRQWSYGKHSPKNRFVTVRSGEAILSTEEEIELIAHFDSIAEALSSGMEKIDGLVLREACVLYWAYQHAFRPIQLASLDFSDARVRTFSTEPPIVHVTFAYAKQRRGDPRQRIVRAMKREWAWLMAHFVKIRQENPQQFLTESDRQNSLFGLSPKRISTTISEASLRISGHRRTPTQFRHTAAQRLVDAGASELELAEFLGHKSINTGLVYFDASPSQADRINKALGLSPIYRGVEHVVRTGGIDIEKLVGLEPDQQIGAVPHGIPVAGIGGCDIGQSACSKNPALSCYTCSKFLPLSDPDVHDEVAREFRSVVDQFISAGRGDPSNPAFMQLRRTLEALELLVHELRGEIS